MEKAISKGNESEAQELQKQLDAIPDVRLYSPPLTDATPEALAKAMETNGGTMSYAAAEGNLFNIASGSYSDNPNIDILLQAYTGEPVYIERIGRAPVMIDHTALSILLAVQPNVLERFLSNETLLERGLCTRFLYSVPKSFLGHRDARSAKPVSEDTARRYAGVIHALVKQSFDGVERELVLMPDALELYYQWSSEVEANIGPNRKWEGIANGWEGKLVGNTIRIAGLLKMADTTDTSMSINQEHFIAATKMARYFVDHALAVTGKSTGLTADAREVLAEIRKQRESPFSPSDLRQKLRFRKRFKESLKVDQALSRLATAGFIRLTNPPEWQGVGRKPEALYEVHPDLLIKEN